jgi:dolichol-phosphate mannosyltransferase
LVIIEVQALFFGVPFPGFGTLAALLVLLFGFLFFLMGILGEYVGKIFTETRERPLYVIRHLHESDE